jgi:hypothetical protein
MTTFSDWKVTSEYYWDTDISIGIKQVKEYLIARCEIGNPVPVMMDDVSFLRELGKGRNSYPPHELEKVDLKVPLIILRDEDKLYLVDGYHRLELAYRKGISKLPTVTMDAEQFLLPEGGGLRLKNPESLKRHRERVEQHGQEPSVETEQA